FDPVGTFYLTAVLIPRAGGAQLFTFRAEADMVRHQSWLRDVSYWSHGENAAGRLAGAIRSAAGPVAGGRAVRVATALDGWLPVSKLRELAACDGLELVAADHEVEDAAVVGADERHEVLRQAAAASNAAIAAGCAAIRDGTPESEIAAAMAGANGPGRRPAPRGGGGATRGAAPAVGRAGQGPRLRTRLPRRDGSRRASGLRCAAGKHASAPPLPPAGR